MIDATLYTDAGCPWAYSANPALRVLEWRFREQLRWRLVMIGLREDASEAAVRTYDPDRALSRSRVFEERYGMPFAVFRTLQIANFTTALYLDDADSIRDALRSAPGVDADRIADRLDDADVVAEYERQQAEARSAAGTPAEAQDKTASSNGYVRYTAPSVVFHRGEERAFAGGWQPLLSYDTVLANFAPGLERVPAPESPEPLLEFFLDGLTTAEVACLLASGSDPIPDREGAAAALSALHATGKATRSPLGSDARWALR